MIAATGSGLQARTVDHMRSKKCVATLQTPQKPTTVHIPATRRSALLAGIAALTVGSSAVLPRSTIAAESPTAAAITILSKEEGTGTAAAQIGDLVLVHYVGRLDNKVVFDSTRGGLNYRDGGEGKFRPVSVKLGGEPMPGVTQGLKNAILGMKINGKVTVKVPSELGFGSTQEVLAPYSVVPAGSVLEYEIELIRLSRRGPDALMTGVTQCGGGFVMERTKGCADITPAEFL
jgi:hypothetical protein